MARSIPPPGNAIIQDIGLAPRNARGMVEYWTDVEVLVPRTTANASGLVLLDVVNRGNKRALFTFNGAPLSNVSDNPGDGFLMRRGDTVVFFGWQPDLLEGDNRVRMGVPVARNPDGSAITGVVRTELVTAAARKTLNLSSGHFTALTHTAYPTVSTDNRTALPDGFRPTLTVRAREQDARVEIPAEKWSFADCEGAAPVATTRSLPGRRLPARAPVRADLPGKSRWCSASPMPRCATSAPSSTAIPPTPRAWASVPARCCTAPASGAEHPHDAAPGLQPGRGLPSPPSMRCCRISAAAWPP